MGLTRAYHTVLEDVLRGEWRFDGLVVSEIAPGVSLERDVKLGPPIVFAEP